MNRSLEWYKRISLIVGLSSAVPVWGAEAVDSTRSYLNKLRAKVDVPAKDSQFEFPFLVSVTAVSTGINAGAAAEKVRAYLGRTALALRSSFGATATPPDKIGREQIPMPQPVRLESQLEAIRECTAEKCLMKLHTAREKGAMQKAPDKLTAYHQLVVERVKAYLSKRELMGYEDRESNVDFVKQMLGTIPFLKERYPTVEKVFREDLWEKKKPPASLQGSFLRQEIVVIAPERLQPIWRLGEVFEFKEPRGQIFVELHIYSNHYFDSSLRIFEILPEGEKSILVLTDVIEIDELTKSALIRMLYRGKMESAVSAVQTEDVHRILD